jgi:hypothetical protein
MQDDFAVGDTSVGLGPMKKGLKHRWESTAQLSVGHSWKSCPDEEGIETSIRRRWAATLGGSWKSCPDEEGFETQTNQGLTSMPTGG